MALWLCENARRSLMRRKWGSGPADEEHYEKLYAHPHFIAAYKALCRRGLMDSQHGGITRLGWAEIVERCSQVRELLLKLDVTESGKE